MIKRWCIHNKYTAVFIAFLICFYGYCISRVYGFIFFPDEFGYWAHAAKAAGYDWSEMVSLGSYYSYGYSLILFPILKLCHNSVMAYRVAVTFNFALIGAVYFILLRLAGRLLNEQNKAKVTLYTAVAVFYPVWIVYAQTTMVEIVLMAMFVLICMLLYDYLENNRMSTLILLVVALVYIHFLHMRAVGVLIAGVVTLITYFLMQKGKIKQFLIAAAIGTVVLIGGFAVKEFVQNGLFGTTVTSDLNVNDYAGQFEKITYMFTKEGSIDFLCGLAGKVLYLGLASFGLAYWGIWFAIKETANLIKNAIKREKTDFGKLIYLFILLSTIGETLINAIYNIRSMRIDGVTYGRYHEFVLPILMLLGIYELSRIKRPFLGTFFIAVAEAPMVYAVLHVINKYQLTNIHGYVMVGMGYLYGMGEFEPNSFYWKTYGLLVAITIIITAIIVFSNKKGREFILVAIIAIEFLLSVRASSLYINSSELGAYRDTIVVDKIEELRGENSDRRIVYIKEDDSPFISILQFMMRDEKINMIPLKEHVEEYTIEEMDTDDIIVLKYDSNYREEVKKQYANHLLNGHFVIYYN